MSVDRIANMLSALKNAAKIGMEKIEIPYTKKAEAIAEVIKDAGLLTEVKKFKESGSDRKGLALYISPSFTEAKRMSKPGQRQYVTSEDLKKITREAGVSVISTSKGIMNARKALKAKLGGEFICRVY